MNPKVSICIPTFGQPDKLKFCLDSISIQSYDNYEIIISDDSLDDSVRILLNEYDFKDKLRYYHNLSPLGSPENWNNAIAKSRGEYIKIMHHDDFFSSNTSLNSYVDLLDGNKDCCFAFSACSWIDKKNKQEFIKKINKDILNQISTKPWVLFLENYISTPSTTIIRKNHIIYNNELKWLVDVDYYIEQIRFNKNIAYTDDVLVNIVINDTKQVTFECISSPKIIINENIYLYTVIIKKFKFNWLIFFRMVDVFAKRQFIRIPISVHYSIQIAYIISLIMFFVIKLKYIIELVVERIFESKTN